VTVEGDEAGDYLRLHQALSGAVYGMLRAVARVMHGLSILLIFILPVVGPIVAPDKGDLVLKAMLFAISGVPLLMVLLPVIVALPMTLSRSGPFGFGEAFLDSMLIDVAVTMRPPSRKGRWVRFRPGGDITKSPFRLLMHSRILEHEGTARRISAWLRRTS
jgi:hypothetical protein